METKNLFSAIKTFINNTPVGQTFTTKQLIGVVGSNETLTRWKAVNSNPFYRTHTYKAYLRRTGFLSFIKRGEWKVEKHIPESYNLGTIEFLIGYKGKTYNGMTREEILNPMVTSLKLGDILEFDGEGTNKEKNMKFNFVEGKERVVDMIMESLESLEHTLLHDIRIIAGEGGPSALEDIESLIESIRYNAELGATAIKRVKAAGSIQGVLKAMEYTSFEEMEETVLCELFGLDSLTID